MRSIVIVCLFIFSLACRSPLTRLDTPGPALDLAPVQVEDHSRQLKRLKRLEPGEANAPVPRRAALDAHGRWLEASFRAEAAALGLKVDPEAPYRLDLRITDLGEVRTKYIVLGIASGVAWGVGTGLLAHDPRLAWGLGGYELVEETAFWIGGVGLFSSFSAPAVVEARLVRKGEDRPVWEETYYSLSGRKWIKALPKDQHSDRRVQLHASLQRTLSSLLEDLEKVPGFPQDTRKHLAPGLVQERILAAE